MSVRNVLVAMTHRSRVLNLDVKQSFVTPKSYITIYIYIFIDVNFNRHRREEGVTLNTLKKCLPFPLLLCSVLKPPFSNLRLASSSI